MERGLRAKTNIIEDACGLSREEINKYLKENKKRLFKDAEKQRNVDDLGRIIIPKD
jgi:ribosomal protein L29